MTKNEAYQEFKSDILPHVMEEYKTDIIARIEAWNNFTDYLCKEQRITMKQYETWTLPFRDPRDK